MGVGLFYVFLNFLAEVAHNEDKFANACFLNLVNNKTENGFSSYGHKGLWLCIGMRTKFYPRTGHRYNRFHNVCFYCVALPKQDGAVMLAVVGVRV